MHTSLTCRIARNINKKEILPSRRRDNIATNGPRKTTANQGVLSNNRYQNSSDEITNRRVHSHHPRHRSLNYPDNRNRHRRSIKDRILTILRRRTIPPRILYSPNNPFRLIKRNMNTGIGLNRRSSTNSIRRPQCNTYRGPPHSYTPNNHIGQACHPQGSRPIRLEKD